jgi:hypothetical protein
VLGEEKFMDDVLIKQQYNKFATYPRIAYNCVSYLINDDESELLWKLLYYTDRNAWRSDSDHPNLTKSQKRNLIYSGEKNQQDFRVFLDFGMDNAWEAEASQIRIGPLDLFPANNMIGNVTVALETYSHFKVNTLSNHQTRTDTITQLLISALNGQDIDGVGVLYFNSRATRQCRSSFIGQIPYKGRRTIMCNWISSNG